MEPREVSNTNEISEDSEYRVVQGNVVVLDRGEHWMVVEKVPGVVCHHSEWTGSRSTNEIPMLQRIRQAVGQRVNLIHRLDRGCSGCLLATFASEDQQVKMATGGMQDDGATHALIKGMKLSETNKTYVALVRGEGILHGRNFSEEGWFKVDRPIRDEKGNLNDAVTWFRFLAGQQQQQHSMLYPGSDQQQPLQSFPRASLVLARPETGRWHQIRRHLNGLSHPILGDSTHGNSKINREFRDKYGMPHERTCLHLAHLRIPPIDPYCPQGINVYCPLHEDMWNMLQNHLPDLWRRALPELEKEGVFLIPNDPRISNSRQVLPYTLTMK